LGDKSNHVATVHLPQMLYLWPAIVFFSWPVTLPFVVNIFTNKWNKLPLRSRFPRTATIVSFLVIAAATICFNTIIHPFSLADNRHYTFYMFRLLRIPTIKYAAIPVYVFCGWLCISALSTPATSIKTQDQDIVRVSWVLVFLISTSLSLSTSGRASIFHYSMAHLETACPRGHA
jgi:alpha-1,2-glucosyltransferase